MTITAGTNNITILGGGMVGATLAVSLIDSPHQITLIDKNNLPPKKDHRLIALTKKSCDFFESIDIWQDLLPYASAIKAVHVSQRGQFGSARLTAKEINASALGYVVPAEDINRVLYQKILAAKNITLKPNTEMNELNPADKPRDDGASITIAADGTHSTLRKLLNLPVETIDYHQSALVTVAYLQRDLENTAYERFHKTGALALLPLQNNRAATIWTDTTETIQELLKLSDEDFVKKLQHQFGYRAGRFLNIEKRYSYPLVYQCMQPRDQIQNNIIFIGNAAHTIHPIAAQGFNIALSEIAFLCEHFKSSPTMPTHLPEQKNIRLSHQLTQIFAVDFSPFNAARNIGIVLLDCFKTAKQTFVRRITSL